MWGQEAHSGSGSDPWQLTAKEGEEEEEGKEKKEGEREKEKEEYK